MCRSPITFPAEHTGCRAFNEKVLYVVALAETGGGLVLCGMLLFWNEAGDGQRAREIMQLDWNESL